MTIGGSISKWVLGIAALGMAALSAGACAVETEPNDDLHADPAAAEAQQALCCTDCDCEPPPPVCGNGICQSGESCSSCPSDCKPYCGNGTCQTSCGESSANCPHDCGLNNSSTGSVCGNSVCEPYESAANCPKDCKGYCGDGMCNTYYYSSSQRETNCNCITDCPSGVGGCYYGTTQQIICGSSPCTGSYMTYSTGCSSKCQSCYQQWSNGTWTAGRCTANYYGQLSCTRYPDDSCYRLWQCC